MEGRSPVVKRAWLGGLACAGVAAAHWIAYLIAPPGGHSHAAGMAATGHRLWPYFMALAAGAFVAGLCGFVFDRVADTTTTGSTLWRYAAARLIPVQVVSFTALELLERLLFADPGHSSGLLTEPVLWVGVALQVLCALAGAAFLVLFAQTIDLIHDLVTGPPAASSEAPSLPQPLRTQLAVRPLAMAAGGPTFRGPPVTL